MTKTIVDYAEEGDLEGVKRLVLRLSKCDLGLAVKRSAEMGHLEVVEYLKGILKERNKND